MKETPTTLKQTATVTLPKVIFAKCAKKLYGQYTSPKKHSEILRDIVYAFSNISENPLSEDEEKELVEYYNNLTSKMVNDAVKA